MCSVSSAVYLDKTVALKLNGCGHCYVRANELLQDVFANLVSNAIKHTGDRSKY